MWSLLLTFLTLLLPLNGIAATVKAVHKGRAPLKGAACDFIFLARVSCPDGSKFVVKQERGVRKQFLVVNGEPVLAFVAKPSQPNAVKFAQCDQHRDITERVGCKPVEGAAGLSLNSTRDPTPEPPSAGFRLPAPEAAVTMWLSKQKTEF